MYLSGRTIAPGETGHTAGRQLLEQMYVLHIGHPMPPIATEPRGKPYFPDGSCHFSITHTKKHVFCVLSDRPVGIDAEELDRPVRPALADKILSEEERAQYLAAPNRDVAFLKFWVLKEALLKCTGEGLQGYPRQTNFSLDDPRLMEMDGCVVAVIEEENYVV